ncbi:hypothetical protein T4D_15375 [Trichinella pseudospiralis]|uniref:Uncharacterized protein n=1 Tax=Trichinella pseudospiralis TaxID=6337 RepID=A0A0V1E7H5_TRIPS|nr:hypothetical protein T4D_15375 [Trichinella pseudospiralis]
MGFTDLALRGWKPFEAHFSSRMSEYFLHQCLGKGPNPIPNPNPNPNPNPSPNSKPKPNPNPIPKSPAVLG